MTEQSARRYIHKFERRLRRDAARTSSSTVGHNKLRLPEARGALCRSPLVLFFLVQPKDHFRRFFPLGYPPLPCCSYEIKPSHSTASLTMKKGGFSFSAAGGPTPRDDSARSDRKENALPGAEVPPLSPTQQSGWWGGMDPSNNPGTLYAALFRLNAPSLLPTRINKYVFILRRSSYYSYLY